MPEPDFIPAPSPGAPAIPTPSSEESIPMLDVHPAHHAAHSWKEFFVHIATIVLGLLIAVSLEQTVEYFHHRGEVQDIREALRLERQENRVFYDLNTAGFRFEADELQNNLRVFLFVQQHPGTHEEKLPGVAQWGFEHAPVVVSSWKNAQQTQVLALMPWEETDANAKLYDWLGIVDKDALSAYESLSRAGSYTSVDPNPSHMTPTQIAAEISLIQEAMRTSIYWAVHLRNLHDLFPDFSPPPSEDAANRLAGSVRSEEDRKKLATARDATNAALAPAYTALEAAGKKADAILKTHEAQSLNGSAPIH